jgi:hydroxyacylglutathione hydrolase
MLVRQIFDPKLAQYAYLVGCPRSGEAIVIDPQRDTDRYFEAAARNKLKLVAAVDTHIHADYLSGLRQMAEHGLIVYASKEGGPEWQYEWLRNSDYKHRLLADGDRFSVGYIEFHAVHTPGHTPEHLSYLIRDAGAGAVDDIALASGDFIFVGDVGRPDLLEMAAGAIGTMIPAAKAQFGSIQRRFRTLPEFLQVWPAHGAGSACGKSLGDVPTSTVGYELRTNRSIQAATDEETFVQFILAGQPEPPAYFARMKYQNRDGVKLLDTLPAPKRLSVQELHALDGNREVVVIDTRARGPFFDGHLTGSLLADLDYQFCTIAGSYVDEQTPIYLVADEARVGEAVRALVRVGLDRIEGYATPETLAEYARDGARLATTDVIDMKELESRRIAGRGRIVDVRGKAEFDSGHVPGALNIAHTRVGLRMAELPKEVPLLVHCNSGARSAAAVSLLERHGYRVVQVNDLIANYRESTPHAGAIA